MPGSAGNSLFIPTGAAPRFEDIFPNDPFYRQGNADIDTWLQGQNAVINQGRTFADRAFGEDTQAAQLSYDPNYDYGLSTAEAQAALAKQKAAHDNANQAEYLNEWLTSRGLHDSGQTGLEQGEREYQYGAVNQGIDIGLEGTRADVAHSKTTAQNNLANLLKQITFDHDKALAGYDTQQGLLPGEAARRRGQLAFDTFDRLTASGALKAPGINAIWDEESQLYVTPDGTHYNASGQVTPWSRPVPPPAAPQAPTYPGYSVPSYTPTNPADTPIINAAQAQQTVYPVPAPFSPQSAPGNTGSQWLKYE